MASDGDNNLTFTIHGLQAYNDEVDGEVFATKFYKLMCALKDIDANLNGTRNLKFLISKLEKNTATAAVKEKVLNPYSDFNSGIDFLYDGVFSIQTESPEALRLPEQFVKSICDISKDAGDSFEKGYIKHSAKEIPIKIDQHLYAISKLTLEKIKKLNLSEIPFFKGEAFISLDGSILTLEGWDGKDTAFIALTAGGQKIKCVMDRIPEDELRQYWKTRCIINGLARYSGKNFFPDFIEAYKIHQVVPAGNWADWRGAFDFSNSVEDLYEY